MKLAQENQLDFAGTDYAELFARSRASAFQSPIWLSNFYKQLAPTKSAEPLIITMRDGDELLGVIPLIRRSKAGLKIIDSADLGVSDYSAPILRDDFQERLDKTGSSNLPTLFKDALGKHDVLRIRPVRAEHVDEWQLMLDCEAKGQDFSAHSVALTAPFSDWRPANLDKKLAGMVARKGKRWKKQHDVKLVRLTEVTDVKNAITELVRLRQGRFDGDPIQQEDVKRFYQSVAIQGAQTGDCETWQVTSDGETAAVLFGLTHNGQFLYLLIGADYDSAGRHSPGLQMYDWIIEDWMDRGGECFDFTIGDEPFKTQYGTKAEPMFGFLKANGVKGSLGLKLFKKQLRRGFID